MDESLDNNIVETAIKLYTLGLNVFPVPSPMEVLAYQEETGNVEKSKFIKPPYLINVVFNNRLHFCNETCNSRYLGTGKKCLPERALFHNLFYDDVTNYFSNLACMMGRTSGNLMTIDCDSPNAFKKTLAIFQEKEIPHWTYSSNRGGGILVRVLEGEAKNEPKSLIEDVQIYGNHHFVVLPPSIHPSGVYYQWRESNPFSEKDQQVLEPVSIQKLDWLGAKLLRDSYEPFSKDQNYKEIDISGYPKCVAKLSNRNQEFIVKGVNYSERNSRLFSAACDMEANHIDYEKAESLLLVACSKCYPPYPHNEAYRTIQSAFSTTRLPARAFQSPAHNWEIAEEFFKKFNWKLMGATWKSDQAVFLAAIERSRMDKTKSFRCSIREMVELTNRANDTVISSLERLSGRYSQSSSNTIPPLLVLDHYDSVSKAAYYRFSDVVMMQTVLEQYFILEDGSDPNVFIQNPATPAGKDVFKKIGIIGWKIWKYLEENPHKTKIQLAHDLQLPIYSIRRALQVNKPLLANEFVTFDTTTNTFISNPFTEHALELVAIELGSSGKSAKVKEQHIRDREIRANLNIAAVREKWLDRRYRWEKRHNDPSISPS